MPCSKTCDGGVRERDRFCWDPSFQLPGLPGLPGLSELLQLPEVSELLQLTGLSEGEAVPTSAMATNMDYGKQRFEKKMD